MEYINTKNCAKLIRTALKEAFPGVKFSVVSSVYSGGSSIRVHWTDGPNVKQVEAVAHTFSGSYFDGMTDYKGSLNHMMDGKQISFGVDFIFCGRDLTEAARDKALARLMRQWPGNFPNGAPARLPNDYRGYAWGGDRDNAELLHGEYSNILTKLSFYLTPKKSKTAARVIFLGNDGYSQVGALNVEDN